MEIVGHGVDIVDLRHVDTLLSLNGGAAEDWLRTGEIELAPEEHHQRVAFIAGRIAAKEAVVKAMSTGFTGDISWSDIEVLRSAEGAPLVQLHGALLNLATQKGVRAWFLSISHTEEQAIASAIAVGA
jgi:holo-[acyl-carrier protein] synthase